MSNRKKPLESSPDSARSISPSRSLSLKHDQHLLMIQYIKTNNVKKCLSNFTKSDLQKFLHSEGVNHVSEELSKKQLLDEARAIVFK
ncbi:unnamed protein product [Phytomonas sp. Hart1]|nr:unnamed protein product [Phytomonas sp. Hart1]|eukprot:CCW67959.1 unnamed protein product [Phytomonas sp. isolate Hart1]